MDFNGSVPNCPGKSSLIKGLSVSGQFLPGILNIAATIPQPIRLQMKKSETLEIYLCFASMLSMINSFLKSDVVAMFNMPGKN